MKNGLSSREKQVLLELSKNARLSDRELAAKLKTSQPTVTRIRSRLWNEKFVDRFLILPNLEKLGLEFHAMTFVRADSPSVLKRAAAWATENPSVLFAGEGEGLREYQFVMESLHANYTEYQAFIRNFREKFSSLVETSSFFLDAGSISKYYHWHTVLEDRLAKVKDLPLPAEKRITNRDRLRQALEKIPNPLKPRDNKPASAPTNGEMDENTSE